MGTKAIFRQAAKAKRSTYNHLFNTQSVQNQNIKHNPNLNNDNTLIVCNDEGKFEKDTFKRNGLNNYDDLVNYENQLDEEAREHYKQYKIQEKKENPHKRVRTKLQSKDLKKEFVIALGGDKNIGNKEDFEDKILKTTIAVLEKKGLDKSNLICIAIHYDEKTPHAHIIYNDYSKLHHTTGTEYCKIRYKDGLDKKQLRQLNRDKFAEFQDLVADNMGMERGQRNSRVKHLENYEYYEKMSNVNTKLLEEQRNKIAENNLSIEKLQARIKELEAENNRKCGVNDGLENDIAANNKTISEQNTKIQTNANLLETRTKNNNNLKSEIQKLREEKEELLNDIDSNNQLLAEQKTNIKSTSIFQRSVEQFERLPTIEKQKTLQILDKTIDYCKTSNNELQFDLFDKLRKDFDIFISFLFGKAAREKRENQKNQPSITKVNRGKDLEIT
jgi:hypothetical protein